MERIGLYLSGELGMSIRSAMPAYQAKRLCPEAIFLKPDFEKYRSISAQIMSIFLQQHNLAYVNSCTRHSRKGQNWDQWTLNNGTFTVNI